MNEKEEVAARLAILNRVYALYPHSQRMEKDGLEVYIRTTADIPIREFARCLDEAAAKSRFMPLPADVREIYQETRPDSPRLNIPTADEAWGSVKRAITGVGHTGIPQFKHPLVARIVHNMGWKELCMSENQEVTRSNFMRMWRELTGREEKLQSYLPKTREQLAASGVMSLIAETSKQLSMTGDE